MAAPTQGLADALTRFKNRTVSSGTDKVDMQRMRSSSIMSSQDEYQSDGLTSHRSSRQMDTESFMSHRNSRLASIFEKDSRVRAPIIEDATTEIDNEENESWRDKTDVKKNRIRDLLSSEVSTIKPNIPPNSDGLSARQQTLLSNVEMMRKESIGSDPKYQK
jgi:hypothetical protein